MNVVPTPLPGVLILEPRVFMDQRGFFYESYNKRTLEEAVGIRAEFVQDNHSYSVKNVLRGLHYQARPKAQAKLVRAVTGSIFDVVVDIRRDSPSFGRWIGELLSAENKRMMWVPEGFAHGFCVLSDHADIQYKTTDYYSPAHERCIRWNDPFLEIDWPLVSPILSEKDKHGQAMEEVEFF